MNERWKQYLRTTDNPSNHEYMAFISQMKQRYNQKLGFPSDTSIMDHDLFTEFIKCMVITDKEE